MQSGDSSFNAAPNVTRSFNVLSAAQFAQGVIDSISGMKTVSPDVAVALTLRVRPIGFV
jgi:hypothetical protein